MVLKYKFRGLMSPVFTSFSRSTGDVELESIAEYAEFLREKGVDGILVNGTTGEGVCMTVSERKLVAEVWMKASKKTGQTVMIQVGGACLKNVLELAKHAEAIGASAILCLAELFHRPTNVDLLVSYLQEVGRAAPNTPLLYYHIPSFTGINLDMNEFLKAGASKIPTLAGIKFTHNNLEEGARCLQVENGDFGVFLGNDQIIAAALVLGFDSLIATTLNMLPEKIIKIQKDIREGRNSNALSTQQELVKIISTITKYVAAWEPQRPVLPTGTQDRLERSTVSAWEPQRPVLPTGTQDKLELSTVSAGRYTKQVGAKHSFSLGTTETCAPYKYTRQVGAKHSFRLGTTETCAPYMFIVSRE